MRLDVLINFVLIKKRVYVAANVVTAPVEIVCILVPFIRDGKIRCKTAFLEPIVFLDIPKYTASLI